MSFEGIKSFYDARKQEGPASQEGGGGEGECASAGLGGGRKQHTELVFYVLLPHQVGCFRALLTTALSLPFSLFPQGQRRAQRHGRCCEDCVSPAGSCSHGGLVRYQDEIWKGSACEFCTCDRGQVTCRTGECAKVECAQVRNEGISVWTVRLSPAGWVVPHLSLPSRQQRGRPGCTINFKEAFSMRLLWCKVNATLCLD